MSQTWDDESQERGARWRGGWRCSLGFFKDLRFLPRSAKAFRLEVTIGNGSTKGLWIMISNKERGRKMFAESGMAPCQRLKPWRQAAWKESPTRRGGAAGGMHASSNADQGCGFRQSRLWRSPVHKTISEILIEIPDT